ncbi:hypothetical protein SAMN04488029_0923 [Reichenbachiella faecimaris]|uniref:NfeD-like C-terminal, partner-binding n=1 Tax=Reichenbachiella faecimaris TaxID=692418 RepID=A0A1W2G7B9_REIFA|nr:hypothetical protein [Reichenbachiella faecimaris]SMD32575.1 hypothetical protein SAMN04488029_0923 [Reichenbachiella faecimaris]
MSYNFTEWWESLDTLLRIYWGIAIPFTIFFLLQLIMTFFFGDIPDDGSADADVEADDGMGFQFFTLKNLVAFFTIFSWTGIACLDSGLSNNWSIFISMISGLVMMLVMGGILYLLGKANASGTIKMKNAIGAVGEVYMEIRAKRDNIGQVQIQVQGTLRTLEAITDDEETLRPGAVITVKEIATNNILIVTKSQS